MTPSRLVFARLDPQAFEQCFLNWIESMTQAMGAQVIPIDGKKVRQSFDRSAGHKAIHVVSAWACEHRLVLGEQKTRSKRPSRPNQLLMMQTDNLNTRLGRFE